MFMTVMVVICLTQMVEGARESFCHHGLPGQNRQSVIGASFGPSTGLYLSVNVLISVFTFAFT